MSSTVSSTAVRPMLGAATDSEDRTLPTVFEGKLAPNYYCRGWNAKRGHYCKAKAGHGTNHLGSGRCGYHGGNSTAKHGLSRRYELKTPTLRDMLEKHEADEAPLDISAEIALLRTLTEDSLNRSESHFEQLAAWHSQRRLDPDQMSAMYRLIEEFEAIANDGEEVSTARLEMIGLAKAAVARLGEDIPRPSQVPDLADAVKIISETTRSVERVFTMRAKNAITYDQLRRFLFATERIIEARIRQLVKEPEEADRVMEKLGEELRGIRP